MSFLVEDSRSFLRAVKRDLEEGEYNLAMFHAEQALQLCAKYKLYLKYGDYPKTHRLKELSARWGRATTPLSWISWRKPT
jgi:HEPN domain-containing protein